MGIVLFFNFQSYTPFISFPCLFVLLVRVSSTILNKDGESELFCFVFNFGMKAFNLLLFSMVLVAGFIQLKFSRIPTFLKILKSRMDIKFCQMLFCIN